MASSASHVSAHSALSDDCSVVRVHLLPPKIASIDIIQSEKRIGNSLLFLRYMLVDSIYELLFVVVLLIARLSCSSFLPLSHTNIQIDFISFIFINTFLNMCTNRFQSSLAKVNIILPICTIMQFVHYKFSVNTYLSKRFAKRKWYNAKASAFQSVDPALLLSKQNSINIENPEMLNSPTSSSRLKVLVFCIAIKITPNKLAQFNFFLCISQYI